MQEDISHKAESWLNSNVIDKETKETIKGWLASNNTTELTEAFYKNLEFGTGGLRGIMGVGSNRMNRYTLGMATQGLANYLLKSFPGQEIKVAIAHDSRNNSRLFADTTADVFSANGIFVYLFESLRPTPELSFAIRELGCQSGVVITASHNPKEYNGYKAYWDDGGQLVAPHDTNVIDEVNAIASFDDVKFNRDKSKVQSIGEDLDRSYIDMLKGLVLHPEIIKAQSDLPIVYSPIHGTGGQLVPRLLKEVGFKNVHMVAEQAQPDGNFPTVVYPNPEESEALSLAIKAAKDKGAELVMATDPDADRVGIAVRLPDGNFELLNGNQTGSLIIYYQLKQWQEKNLLDGNQYIVKTIVTTDLIHRIAEDLKVTCYDTLTGFKFIASIILELEGKAKFIAGGEESYGYLIGDKVRDKDAIASCLVIAEIAAYAKSKGKNMYDLLLQMYKEYGLYRESLLSITKKGKEGAEAIEKMMHDLRENLPNEVAGIAVDRVLDYNSGKERIVSTGEVKKLDYPKSDVVQLLLADGSKISARPSGTEPKIKFYFSVNQDFTNDPLTKQWEVLGDKIEKIKKELNLE